MSLCASCGLSSTYTVGDLCGHHTFGDADWARTNRIMCDLLHRRQGPARLTATERADETYAEAYTA